MSISSVHEARLQYDPPLPPILRSLQNVGISPAPEIVCRQQDSALLQTLGQMFPNTCNTAPVQFTSEGGLQGRTIKVGVVLSGGQAPGGHNVIAGIYDALQKLGDNNELWGFTGGPGGIVDNEAVLITQELVARYRNTGGFDMIGSGRTKIKSAAQFCAVKDSLEARGLDGLVVIGGDDSNTNAALIAEYLAANGSSAVCVGVPKTIDGDLANEHIEVSFGFDTCTKSYADDIASVARDARSAQKLWFFIKLMGRSASHITLECARATQPNISLISEEVEAKQLTLQQLVGQVCDVVCRRAVLGKNYGVVLIPEGLVEFIPDLKLLIAALNRSLPALAQTLTGLSPSEKLQHITQALPPAQAEVFSSLPFEICQQLILDRDPHGNVIVSAIDTERLFGDMVAVELERRRQAGRYNGKFSPSYIFCGYQGRSVFPSNFDSKYCLSLGHVAALLVAGKRNGYIACVKNLALPVQHWLPCGLPIAGMLTMEERHGQSVPVIEKYLVDLEGKHFREFAAARESWVEADAFRYPGPIQFFGPAEITEATTFHLRSRL